MKWDQNNPEKVKDFIAKMKQDYAFKKAYAARRAWEFYNHPDVAGMCYVAVGGLDSITLLLFLRSIGIDVPGTSVSMLEDRSIQKVHKALGIRALHTLEAMERSGTRRAVLVAPGTNGIIDPAEIGRRVSSTTNMVTVMAANNEVGTLQPIQEISKEIRKHGSKLTVFHTDAVQAIGHIPVDVQKMGVDMLSLSAHKFGGPKGIGVLYCRQGVQLDPLLYGGGQERGRRPGTENVPAIAGMAAAMRTACENMEDSANTVRGLRNRLLQRIGEIQGNRIYGSMEARLPGNINCSFAGIEGETMVLMLDLAGVCVSAGSACTSGSGEPSHVLTAMGLSRRDAYGAIRITLGEENTAQEVDYIAATIENIVADLRKEAPANG